MRVDEFVLRYEISMLFKDIEHIIT